MNKHVQKSAETQARILETTLTCFGEYGVDGTSIDLIAKEAGVTKPTVYSHYESKEALFSAAIKEVAVSLQTDPWKSCDPSREIEPQLVACFDKHIAKMVKPTNIKLYRALVSQLGEGDLEKHINNWGAGDSLEIWLTDAKDKQLLPEIDVPLATKYLWAMVRGRLFYPVFSLGLKISASERKQELEYMVKLFMRSISSND